MPNPVYKVSPYRWVVLASFMLVNLVIQVLWISYAPITADAARFYGVTELAIGFLAMVFMVVYVPLSIPVAWLIDRWGFHKAAGFGAVLMMIFAGIRALVGSSYTGALVGTIGLAVAQPFFLNAWTKMPAHWHPEHERATAVGLITLSNLLGIAGGMVLTPLLMARMMLPRVQMVYAAAAAVSALIFIVLGREYPPTPVGPENRDNKALMLDGLKHALAVPSFRYILVIVFIGMGLFNGVTTWIEQIVRTRGFGPEDAGTFGALLLVGGIFGAGIIPALSDRTGRRKPWMFGALLAAVPGIVGMALGTGFLSIAVSSFFLGFFLTSVMPLAMQFSVEITKPTPEGTSNGLIQLFGQTSVVCVFFMQVLRDKAGSFTTSLFMFAVLIVAGSMLILLMRGSRS